MLKFLLPSNIVLISSWSSVELTPLACTQQHISYLGNINWTSSLRPKYKESVAQPYVY